MTTAAPAVEQLRKFTLKGAGLNKTTVADAVNAAPDGKAKLLNLAGIVTNYKPDQTDLGEFLRLYGEFRCVNLLTGELSTASVAILPNFFADQLKAVFDQSGNAEFAVQFGAKKSDTVTGYEWTVTPLTEMKGSDRMQELSSVIMAAAPALPAPSKPAPSKSDEAPAPAAKSAKAKK